MIELAAEVKPPSPVELITLDERTDLDVLFTSIYEKYLPQLGRYLGGRFWGIDYGEIENLVQETFTKFYTVLPTRKRLLLPSYLLRIAHNLAVDHGRKLKTHPAISFEATFLPERGAKDPQTRDPKDLIEQIDITEVLRPEINEALQILPAHQRTAVILRECCDLSVEETAQRMGKSEGAVRILLYRGNKKMRGLLQDYAPQSATAHYSSR